MMPSNAENQLRHRFPHHDWRLATYGGYTDASVYHLTGPTSIYVKIAPETGSPDPGASPCAEAPRLEWLRTQHVPCPEVIDTGIIDGYEYLISAEVPGIPACSSWPAAAVMTVVDAVADFAAELHRLPVDTCPFDRRLKATIPMAQEVAALGEVDLDSLDAERRGWSTTRLVTELIAGAKQVGREEAVVCHGDFCLPNILIDPQSLRVTAIIDVGRLGVADRYTDLALMTRSMTRPDLNEAFSREQADRFVYRYGELPADNDRIALYRLLDEFF